MGDPTFTGDTTLTDDLQARPTQPQSASASLGRVTVLPRLGDPRDSEGPSLLEEELPRFEPIGPLGEGGLGVVIAARDLDIGRRVAIKKIRPDRRTQGAFLRFVQEVRTVGRLDHPNIVPIHDVGRDEDGSYWFVMKYVDGETLEAILVRLRAGDPATHARWTFERRAELFLQMLHAIRFAHDRGVIHRDLKPANVMVGSHGEVQIVDWGVARQLDQDEVAAVDAPNEGSTSVTTTRAGQLIGTPAYMSPEQARGDPVDFRTDTWALSLVFYELLTLQHPFEGLASVEAVLAAVKTGEVPHPGQTRHPYQSSVPADLAWFAADGLDRANRYPTVAAMISRLERRNDGEIPVQCPVTFQKSLIARGVAWIDRNPYLSVWVLATCAVVALLCLVGMVGTMALAALAAQS